MWKYFHVSLYLAWSRCYPYCSCSYMSFQRSKRWQHISLSFSQHNTLFCVTVSILYLSEADIWNSSWLCNVCVFICAHAYISCFYALFWTHDSSNNFSYLQHFVLLSFLVGLRLWKCPNCRQFYEADSTHKKNMKWTLVRNETFAVLFQPNSGNHS